MTNTEFDNQLNEIAHYQIHKEMLPFVGARFNETKILLISESHYVPKECKETITDDWYKNRNFVQHLKGNHNTRNVANGGNHPLFKSIVSASKEVNPALDFSCFAWYNFYQKPAQHKDSIKKGLTNDDKKIAREVFEKVITILQPSAVIFLSKLAFDELWFDDAGKRARRWNNEKHCHNFKDYDLPMYSVQHPNSAWWNKISGKNNMTGKQRFKNVLTKLNSKAV